MIDSSVTLEDILSKFTEEQRANLSTIMEGREVKVAPSVDELHDRIKWMYFSKLRKGADTAWRKAVNTVSNIVSDKGDVVRVPSDSDYVLPSYGDLIREAAKSLKVHEPDENIETNMENIAHAVILTTLQKMKPADRRKQFGLFAEPINEGHGWNIRDKRADGPLTAFGVFGAINATGFGVYLASTTAVGMITSAMGVTLPFAFYTGMTSALSVALGPVGFLAGTAYFATKMTSAEWNKIVPAMCFINAVLAMHEGEK